MAHARCARMAGAVALVATAGCSSPFRSARHADRPLEGAYASAPESPSAYRPAAGADTPEPVLPIGATPTDFIEYALAHSPAVEAAYQRWRAATERLPQVGALPDPRVSVGVFTEEVETRVGPQQVRLGVRQALPWPAVLAHRKDAAASAARAAWLDVVAARLALTDAVLRGLYEVAYADAAIRVTGETADLIRTFEAVVRARYRTGAGSHPDMIRAQVELAEIEDRVAHWRAVRVSLAADLNTVLNRDVSAAVGPIGDLPGLVAVGDAEALSRRAIEANPTLLALAERVDTQRILTRVARAEGMPDLSIGVDYIVTGNAINPATPGSGNDAVLVTLGVDVPLWRAKYSASVRESIARRLAVSRDREDRANRILSEIHRAWFEHTDAERRVTLFNQTLIPKANESLRAALGAYRSGDGGFLDVLDAERSLLEFTLSAERARADRGRALSRLIALVGEDIPTRPAGAPQEPAP